MKNRLFMLVLLSLFVISVAAPAVYAFTVDDIIGENSFVGKIFYDVPEAIESGSPMGTIAARILIGALVFVILFGGTQLLFNQFGQNVRLAIAGLIAAIAVFAIPEKMIREIFFLWGGVLYFIMVGVPIVLGTYFLFKKEDEKTRFYYFIRALIAAILTYIASGLSSHFVPKTGLLSWLSESIITIFTFLTIGYAIAAIYFAIRWLSPGTGEKISGVADDAVAAVGRRFGRGTRRWWRKVKFGEAPKHLENLEAKMVDIEAELYATTVDSAKVARLKREALDVLDKTEQLKGREEQVAAFTEHESKDLPAGPLKTRIEKLLRGIAAANTNIHTELDKIRTEFEKTSLSKTKARSLLRGEMRTAKRQEQVALAKEVSLYKIIRDL